MLVGLALFAIGAMRAGTGARTHAPQRPVDGAVARRPVPHRRPRPLRRRLENILPNWVDIAVVIAFSLAIFYWAVALTLSKDRAAAAVAKDARQIDYA